MEYFRCSYPNIWEDLPDHPQWILDRENTNSCNDDLDPLISHQDVPNVWDFAEVAIDIYIFAQTFDIPPPPSRRHRSPAQVP
jgi:hypothetical protein